MESSTRDADSNEQLHNVEDKINYIHEVGSSQNRRPATLAALLRLEGELLLVSPDVYTRNAMDTTDKTSTRKI